MAEEGHLKEPGKHFKALRKQNGWTLDQVAKLSGISKSTLSKFENGISNLTFTSITKLADGLGLPIAALTTPHDQKVMARRSLTRLGGGAQFSIPEGALEILCSDLADNSQAFMRLTIKAHNLAGQPKWHRHPGQEFIYVLEGKLELHTEAYDPLLLHPHDSIIFDAEMGHKYVAKGRKDAVLLVSYQSAGFRYEMDSL